jgi:hypothetical protein
MILSRMVQLLPRDNCGGMNSSLRQRCLSFPYLENELLVVATSRRLAAEQKYPQQTVQVRKGAERQILVTYLHLPSVAPAGPGPMSLAEICTSQMKITLCVAGSAGAR